MINVQTFDLIIFLRNAKGTGREYISISRPAVKRYIEFWQEHEDFMGYDFGVHESLVRY
jgi:hypothetical protein